MSPTASEELESPSVTQDEPNRPEPPSPSPQKLPYDILLYTSTFLFAQKADKAIASLAASSRLLNEKLVPSLYRTVHLHSLASFKHFFQYYRPASLARKRMSPGANSSTCNENYGNRHNYLGGLIKNMEMILPRDECERQYRWIKRLRKEWKAQRKNVLQPGSQIIKVSTLYLEEAGEACPCRPGRKPFITYDPLTPEGLLVRSVYPTYLGLGARRDSDKYPSDYCKGCQEHSGVHGTGYWNHTFKTGRMKDHFAAIQAGYWIAPFEKHIYLIDGKSIAFNSCLDIYSPGFFAIPSNQGKSERSLVILTPDPNWDSPPSPYDALAFRLRAQQKYRQINFLINKKAPFSNADQWRTWIEDKAEWLESNPGTWESWAPSKQRLYTARLDEIVAARAQTFAPHAGLLHLFTLDQLREIIAMK